MIRDLGRLINVYIRPYWGFVGIVVLLQTVATIMTLLMPTLNARIIDEGVVQGDTAFIWRFGGIMLGLAFIQVAAQIAAVWAASRTSMAFGRDIRTSIFDRVLSFSIKELNQFGAPSLITRNTNDVQQVQMLVHMTLVMLVSAPITMAVGVAMAVREDFGLTWIVLVAVVILAVGIIFLISFMGPLFQKMQSRIDNLNRVLREQITGIRVVRAFTREQHEASRFEQANSDLTDTTLKVGRLMISLFPFVGLVMNISTVGVMWFGAHRISEGHLEIGQLTAFIAYLMQILMAVMMTTMLLVMAPRAAVCADRIQDVLETDSSVVDPEHPVAAVEQKGIVEFRNVEFSYPGAEQPVLKNISFTAKPGKMTAIIGSTGSGKSTLVNLIPRLFDVTGGNLFVDGVNTRDVEPNELWERIGIVPQKPYLFSGTIASNLRYGRPEATEDEMWSALRIAQAEDFVKDKENQLDATISQGGTNVSGGQRQRIAIARALVKRPKIYIFDDSFSALDVSTDARLRAALRPETRDATVIIVAQRVATIQQADQILVLDDGEIVGRGTHDELLASNETYQEIVNSQLSAEATA